MHELGVDPAPLLEQAESQRREGASVMFLAVGGVAAGLLAVTDPIKASTQEATEALHATCLRIVMATADGKATANAVALPLGTDALPGEGRPQDKRSAARRVWKDVVSTFRLRWYPDNYTKK